MLCPAMPRRLSARAALALPFLQRMAAAPRELRRAPSGELRAVLSIHSVDSGAGAEDPNPARNPCVPISEGGASAGSSDRVDADSAMGSQLAGLGLGLGSGGGAGRATAAAAAVKARLSRASAAIALAAGRGYKAPPPPEKRGWPPAFLRLHACIGCAPVRSGCVVACAFVCLCFVPTQIVSLIASSTGMAGQLRELMQTQLCTV